MKSRNFFLPLAVIAACITVTSCHRGKDPGNRVERAMYFWKSSLSLSGQEADFLSEHRVSRLYVKFFDVVPGGTNFSGVMPVATTVFPDPLPELLSKDLEIVPVVFIREGCLDYWKGSEDFKSLADLVDYRVSRMCTAAGINASEWQLDFDWTKRNRDTYFAVLERLSSLLAGRGIRLSATIRLHQLSDSLPPVDSGVLMLYNTGNFRSAATKNSILTYQDAKPYLKGLKDYALPLSAAFPNFSWTLRYHDGNFSGIYYGTENPLTQEEKDSGWLDRHECADIKEIFRVRKEIKKLRKDVLSQTIIYDLNSRNLSNLKENDYERIWN